MSLVDFIHKMPKVELHVHLEGSIQPQTLLQLAQRNSVRFPVDSVPALRRWYTFTDFDRFLEIYHAISACICTPDDVELIAREFIRGQAEQNIRYSEVIYTPYTHYASDRAIPFPEQVAALGRAREWGAAELDTHVGWVFDVSRDVRPVEHSLLVADWAIRGIESGVVGFGIGGPESGNPPELFRAAFDRTRAAGLASLPHAGEVAGPESMWGALEILHADRIGHGVRCLEDPSLVALLRELQLPLDVSPSSNVCVGVAPSLAEHPLPHLLSEGLYVTINSDDPSMFNTTLTDEYLRIASAFGFGAELIEGLVLNGVRASSLPPGDRMAMEERFRGEFAQLRTESQM